jgi:hypothetical protein
VILPGRLMSTIDSEWELNAARMAAEFWKLLRGFERTLLLTPTDSRKALSAQARYAREKLETITAALEMQIVSFDGLTFEVNLPAVAVNPEDVAKNEDVIVERTIEPAVVSNGRLLLTGRVFLAGSDAKEREDVSRN